MTVSLRCDHAFFLEKLAIIKCCLWLPESVARHSVKSEKHEYLGLQADLLPDETERHNARRKYRRTRRNRKCYRKPRFNNRKREKGWLAPSIRHKVEAQLLLL